MTNKIEKIYINNRTDFMRYGGRTISAKISKELADWDFKIHDANSWRAEAFSNQEETRSRILENSSKGYTVEKLPEDWDIFQELEDFFQDWNWD